jgi:hypothetical protein
VVSSQTTLKLTGGLLLFSACSFVNSFDDLGEVMMAGAGTSSNAGESSGATGGTGAGGEGAVDSGGASGQGGSVIGAGADTGMAGMEGMAGAPNVEGGMVLVGAAVGTPTKYFLVTLDPTTGKELTRVQGPRTLGLAYDTPRDESDIWYVFLVNDSGNPNDAATLSVRHYNESDGTFEELSSAEVPAPTNADSIAVLRNRVFYRSVVLLNNIPSTGFTLLDTTKLDDVRVMGQKQAADLPEGMVGLLSHPSLAADGGAVSIIQQVATECAADAGDPTIDLCAVRARRGTLGSTATAVTIAAANKSVVVGHVPRKGGILGLAGWTAAPGAGLGRDIFVFPPKDHMADPNGLLSIRNPADFGELSSLPIAVPGKRIPSVAFDPCRDLVLATEGIEASALFAFPTSAAGTAAKELLAHSGGRVLYEAYTKTVISTFEDASNPSIDAWTLNGTELLPTFKKRARTGASQWAPPTDLNPGVIAVKTPANAPCD